MLRLSMALYAVTGLFWLGYYLPCALRYGWYRLELLAVGLAGAGSAGLLLASALVRRMTAALAACWVAFLLCTAVFLAVEAAILAAERSARRGRERGAPAVILVPGYRLLRDGAPAAVLTARLTAARAYLDGHPAARAVLSGGSRDGGSRTEAAVMAGWLEERGVGPDRLLREERSATTAENMRFCRTLTEGNIGLVTSGFHLYRAVGEARKAGFAGVTPLPAGNGPALLTPYHRAREFLTILKDKANGYL